MHAFIHAHNLIELQQFRKRLLYFCLLLGIDEQSMADVNSLFVCYIYGCHLNPNQKVINLLQQLLH